MPNLCDYSCIVTGPKKGIDRFIQAAVTRYHAGEPNEPEHFWRVFEFNLISYEQLNKDIYQLKAFGYCAWSVSSCFMLSGYQSSNSDIKHNGVTAIQISVEENLIVEFYSTETGCCFAEHILIVNGDLYIDDCVDYVELNNTYTLKEFNEYTQLNWTEKQYKDFFSTNDWYVHCDFNFEFTDHLKYL